MYKLLKFFTRSSILLTHFCSCLSQVEALVSRIERIRHSRLHQSISESVEQWQHTIRELQTKRKEEMGGSGRGRLGPGTPTRFYDNQGNVGWNGGGLPWKVGSGAHQ